MSEDFQYSRLVGDERKAALTFGGGAAHVLYEGAGFALIKVAEMFGYKADIDPLTAQQQKELAEASARALAYVIGSMVSNPVLACFAALSMALWGNASFEQLDTKQPDALPEPESEPEDGPDAGKSMDKAPGANGEAKALPSIPKCCAAKEYMAEDFLALEERGIDDFALYRGHHPQCRHFK